MSNIAEYLVFPGTREYPKKNNFEKLGSKAEGEMNRKAGFAAQVSLLFDESTGSWMTREVARNAGLGSS